ncbi:hypothetical protein [Ralstonia pickettii]|uniref:Transmembrane protein n=2 Tax=root TaxID=1 RepID=B2UBX2_RALPJ|nr:hypothetical protein [Ralstonia pickettii]NP_932297.1 ORF2 [Ralstonia phage p12J]AAQ90247.1 putative minor coat protein [Ralstonia phage p12J]
MGPFSEFDPVRAAVGMFFMGASCFLTLIVGVNFFSWMEARADAARRRASVWREHCRWARSDFLDDLRMREEAYLELDGSKLDLADEFLREDLHQLGGLAGAW